MYYLSMNKRDLKWLPRNSWLEFLAGSNPNYPEQALRADFSRIRQKNQLMKDDITTPDTRLADDPMPMNPASISALNQLMQGGIHPGHKGSILHCGVRYFDPVKRRAGISDDVAALVDSLSADGMTLTLININQLEPREVLVQAGGYAEHQFLSVTNQNKTVSVNDSVLRVRLAPGSGSRLTISMKRYANQPTMRFPWDR